MQRAAGRRNFLVGAAGGLGSAIYGRELSAGAGAAHAARKTLGEPRALFVDPIKGRDRNDGRARQTPFKTIQHAFDFANDLDLNTRDIFIQLADGVYREAVRVVNGPIGSGNIILVGNRRDPSRVVIDCEQGNALAFASPAKTYVVQGLRLQTRTAGENCLIAHRACFVYFDNVDFAECRANHIVTQEFSQVMMVGDYSISGGAEQHWYATNHSLITCSGFGVSFSNTPHFRTAFAAADRMGGLNVVGNTFRGRATGRRYVVGPTPSWITSGNANMPGNMDGTASGQGVFT